MFLLQGLLEGPRGEDLFDRMMAVGYNNCSIIKISRRNYGYYREEERRGKG